MDRSLFVDVHSHVVPSGDDGAAGVGEGEVLCRDAARHGTGVLFATPHVWPHLPLTVEREREVRARFAELAPRAGLDLRLGFELTPAEEACARIGAEAAEPIFCGAALGFASSSRLPASRAASPGA